MALTREDAAAEALRRGIVQPQELERYGLGHVAKQFETGFIRTQPSGAPDKMGTRADYTKGRAYIDAERKGLTAQSGRERQLDTFDRDNQAQGTGGIVRQIPFVRDFVGAFNPAMREMDNISQALQVGSVPPGQGAVSNFERGLMGSAQPRTQNTGGVNSNIINRQRAMFAEQREKLGAAETYLAKNGTIDGFEEAWSAYRQANPYEKNEVVDRGTADRHGYPAGQRQTVNGQRQRPEAYFGYGGAQPKTGRDAKNQELRERSAAAVPVYNLSGKRVR